MRSRYDEPDEHGQESGEHDLNAAFDLEKISNADGQRGADQDNRPHYGRQTAADRMQSLPSLSRELVDLTKRFGVENLLASAGGFKLNERLLEFV